MELPSACILKASLKSTPLGPEMDKAGTRDVREAWEALVPLWAQQTPLNPVEGGKDGELASQLSWVEHRSLASICLNHIKPCKMLTGMVMER